MKKEKKEKKKSIKKFLRKKKGVFTMTPLDNSFESLLLKKITNLSREEINRYNNILALSQDLRMLGSVIPPDQNKQVLENNLDRALNKSYKILNPYWKRYQKLHKIWLSRRRFAMYRGDLFQIVSSWDRLKKFMFTYSKYFTVTICNNMALVFSRENKSSEKIEMRKKD